MLGWSWAKKVQGTEAGDRRSTYLLAAVESLTFLPSKEAKCCSRASRRLLGAWRAKSTKLASISHHEHLCVWASRTAEPGVGKAMLGGFYVVLLRTKD